MSEQYSGQACERAMRAKANRARKEKPITSEFRALYKRGESHAGNAVNILCDALDYERRRNKDLRAKIEELKNRPYAEDAPLQTADVAQRQLPKQSQTLLH